jgi:hypothetical protein
VRLEPEYSSLLSRPSISTLLLRARRPPNVKPLAASGEAPGAVGAGGAVKTPGASRTKSSALRLWTGSSSILSPSTEDTTEVCVVSIDSGWAVTVTFSDADAGTNTMSSCAVCPRERPSSARLYRANPA